MTVREPLGVIAAITPFNFPLNLSMHKIAPALACGNTVVHKPASATPLSALRLARLFHDAGLPAGALNVVVGGGGTVGDQLVRDERPAMVTFTGSPAVGFALRAQAGRKKVTLELGNNSAVLVEADADISDAVRRCVAGAYANSGQSCISVQRIYVQQDVYEQFVAEFRAAVDALVVGHPMDDATQVASLINAGEAERVSGWLAEAVSAGASQTGGECNGSATIRPAVLTHVPADAKVIRQEVFGPVAAIQPYKTFEDGLSLLNDSAYGLQASIFTRDLQRAFAAAERAQVGGFLINEGPSWRADQMPYGGVKQSGMRREGPRYAMEEMTEPKLVVWRVGD